MHSQRSLSVRGNLAPLIHLIPTPIELALPGSTWSVLGLSDQASLIPSSNRAAVPHRSMNDDQYRGYDIPADTVVIPNVWSVDDDYLPRPVLTSSWHRAMTRDEQMYPDAHKFNPERFLDQNGPETDPKDFIFGFGRRQAASHMFWLYLSSPYQDMSRRGLRGRERVDSCGLHNCCVPDSCVAQRAW